MRLTDSSAVRPDNRKEEKSRTPGSWGRQDDKMRSAGSWRTPERRRFLMKRWVIVVVLLSSILSPSYLEARHKVKRYLTKETTVDMKNMNRIFLGWVDMVPEDWAVHGYTNKAGWAAAIDSVNNAFQRLCQTKYLPGHTVTGAKEKGDENAAGNDLYIKFSDVRIDYDNYHLYLSIHFIDPKTNSELASIPVRPYYGDDWGFVNYLRAALDEVNVKLQVEITGGLQQK
jgi:hypothetical protein